MTVGSHKMTTEKICDFCGTKGTKVFSRCGHILHENCYKNATKRQCPTCKIYLHSNMELELIFIEIQNSDQNDIEKKELRSSLESITRTYYYKNTAHYNQTILAQLQKFGWDINHKMMYGDELFNRACATDDIENLNILIEHGLDLKEYGQYGLGRAFLYSSHTTYDRLKSLGIKMKDEIIFAIISYRNIEWLKRAIEAGVDVNIRGERCITPILAAAERGSIEMVKILVDNGADFNAVDNRGFNIVFHACNWRKDIQLLKYLIESGFDPDISLSFGHTPLLEAINTGNNIAAYFLINMTEKRINFHDIIGRTPLHNSVIKRNPRIVGALIRKGANVNAKDKRGHTPLFFTFINPSQNGGKLIAKMLLKHGATI